jgi:hypothetical protein
MNARNFPNHFPPDLDFKTMKQCMQVKYFMFVNLVTNIFILVVSYFIMKLHTGLNDHTFAMFVERLTNPTGI